MNCCLMDTYVLARMFTDFDKSAAKQDRTTGQCNNLSRPENIIFYGGDAHTQNYVRFIKQFGGDPDVVVKTKYREGEEKDQCIDLSDVFPNGFQFPYDYKQFRDLSDNISNG